jgi:hypothetical protein
MTAIFGGLEVFDIGESSGGGGVKMVFHLTTVLSKTIFQSPVTDEILIGMVFVAVDFCLWVAMVEVL